MAFASTAVRHDTSRSSLPVIPIAAPSGAPARGQRHIVAFICPGEERMARNLADDCFRLGLSLRMLHTDSDEFTDATIGRLHASGEIGGATHRILVGHGTNRDGQHRIASHFCRSGADGDVYPAERDSLLLLGSLREADDIDPATGECRIWKGMIHVLIQAPELAAALLDHGADANQPDRLGDTALHHAVKARSLALIRVLAGANAAATIRSDGLTPVELAARTGFDAGFAALATAGYWRALKAGNRRLAQTPAS